MKNYFKNIELKKWLIILLILVVIGLLNFGVIITKNKSYDRGVNITPLLVDELTGTLTIIFLMPFLIWLFDHYQIKKENLIYRIPLYLLTSMIFGFIHTNLMTVSREFLYDMLKLGEYNQGKYLFRLLMEYQKQFIVFWIIYFVYYFVKSNREKQQVKLKSAELEKELTKSQLYNLQSQLNPHFLFNTLSMISTEVYNNPKHADKMISNLSELLRISLGEVKLQKHSLENEIELTKIYIEIMQARFEERLVINWLIKDAVLGVRVPRLLFQPIVENSIKYGVDEVDELVVNITATSLSNKIIITIEDNGPGLGDVLEGKLKEGVGLSNLKERMNKIYGEHASADMKNNEQGGLTTKLIFPLEGL